MEKAYAYLRVSGRSQIDGDGFTRQLAAIKKHAAANDITIVHAFREKGVSGTKELENRPALQELMTALHSNGTKLVLVEKLDRLARDLLIQESIVADMRRNHFEIVSVMEPDLCSDDPSRTLMRQVLGAFAQYERAMIVMKLRGARMRKRADTGRCEGRKPYGARAGETAIIDRMKGMRHAGTPWATIAATLNGEGISARAGRWHANSVRRVVVHHTT